MPQNKNRLLVVLVIVLVIVLGVVLFKDKIGANKDEYSIVYLSTGEVYVGKLTTFPNLELKNSYILQIAKDEKDPTKSKFQLNPTKDALWAPKTLHLVRENIIFYGPLSPDSKIAQTLASQVK